MTTPLRIESIFEVHLAVADRARSVSFYTEALGFELAHQSDKRDYSFLWMGARGERMLGLWGPNCPDPPMARGQYHFAMAIELSMMEGITNHLRALGITPLDFDGQPTDEPIVLAWMPAVAVYFHDPDGHQLEYISMLPEAPRPELGVLPYAQWRSKDK